MTGLRVWLWQRGTAVLLLAYTLWWVFLCQQGGVWDSHEAWLSLWQGTLFRVLTAVALTSVCVHAMIGVWMVLTDYLKAGLARVCVVGLWYTSMMACWFWGLGLIWGLT